MWWELLLLIGMVFAVLAVVVSLEAYHEYRIYRRQQWRVDERE
jgi:hypothetical protein